MKKNRIFILLLFIFLSYNGVSQNYFEGKRLYCPTENVEAKRLFDLGVETLYLNRNLNEKYLNMTMGVFLKAYKTDSTFCDAAFFIGYTLRLLNRKEAAAFYYIADSLSNNKSYEFKVNLAAEALKFQNTEGIKLARKKYNELIKYFPDKPEGYYGIAITAPEIGDLENGLENANKAIEKYNLNSIPITNDVYYIKGVLQTMLEKYEEGLENLELVYSTYKKDDMYKTNYALCLLKNSELKNDEKMKKKAIKIFDSIEDKSILSKKVIELFSNFKNKK